MKTRFSLLGVGLTSILLSSCGISSESSSFNSLFESHVDRAISVLETAIQDSDFTFEGTEDSTLRIAGNMGTYGSGEIAGTFLSQSVGASRASVDMSITGMLDVMGQQLIISEAKGNLLSIAGDLYARIDALSLSGNIADSIDPTYLTTLEKYYGKYIAFRQDEMATSPEDMLAATIQKNLYSFSLEDFKSVIVKYPPLKPIGTGTMSGKMQTYNVELDKENIQNLIVTLTEKLSGTGLTDSDKESLAEALSGVTLTGVLAIDTEDPLYFTFSGQLSVADAPEAVSISVSLTREVFSARIMEEGTQAGIAIMSSVSDVGRSTEFSVISAGETIGTLTCLVNEKMLVSLTGSLEVQNMTSTLEYTRSDDGTFKGTLAFPMTEITWDGTMKDDLLTALSLHGETSGVIVDMGLTPGENDWIKGPLTITQDGTSIAQAELALLAKKETFGFRADVTTPELPEALHFEMDATSVRTKKSVTIDVPTDVVPFMTFAQEFGGYTTLPEESTIDYDMPEPALTIPATADMSGLEDAMLDASSAPLPENQ